MAPREMQSCPASCHNLLFLRSTQSVQLIDTPAIIASTVGTHALLFILHSHFGCKARADNKLCYTSLSAVCNQ